MADLTTALFDTLRARATTPALIAALQAHFEKIPEGQRNSEARRFFTLHHEIQVSAWHDSTADHALVELLLTQGFVPRDLPSFVLDETWVRPYAEFVPPDCLSDLQVAHLARVLQDVVRRVRAEKPADMDFAVQVAHGARLSTFLRPLVALATMYQARHAPPASPTP